jgi:hypothetical protein
VFLGRQAVGGAQVALQCDEAQTVFEADEMIGRD